MKIGLDMENKVAKEYTPPIVHHSNVTTEKSDSIRLDINGMYTDGNAYGKHGKTTEEIMQEAGTVNVQTARNFMTVMSNTMSGEDYKKAMEDGFDPSDMNPEETVTILDHIKAAMAQSGEVVEGYNDDIDSAVMQSITGMSIDSKSLEKILTKVDIPATDDNIKKILEAVNMLSGIDSLPDGSIKYMVENDLDPTIENVYTARYSATDDGSRQAKGYYAQDFSGYFARKADDIDWESMLPQIEKAIMQMEDTDISKEEKLEDAKWLLEKGIPVTEDKINKLENIESVEFPVPVRHIVKATIQAIIDGLEPKQANLAKEGTNYSKAYELQKNLLDSELSREISRLKLSLDANIRLVKQGVNIDTLSIEETINALMDKEQELREQFFGEGTVEELDSKVTNYIDTRNVIAEIPTLPASVIAKATAGDTFTLSYVHKEGVSLRDTYMAASITYEAVGTEVRSDLGDSINKAFRNVDDILRELGMDITPDNERAVRILGYNSMVINEQEVNKIVQADSKLQNVLKNLTPAKTLQLIREGINPLDLNIDEVVRHLERMDSDPKRDAERFSRFLYKLDQSKEITKEERDSFIGIYRLVNRIEKTDHAAIGSIMETGAELTFANLLTAMRSSKKSFDVAIDDDFGLLTETVKKGISITDQIEKAFRDKVGDANYERANEEFDNARLEEIRETAKVSDDLISQLIQTGVEVTPNNIEALVQFNHNPNELFGKMMDYENKVKEKQSKDTVDEETSDIEDAIAEFTDKFVDSKEAVSGYHTFIDSLTERLSSMSDMVADNLMDIKSIGLMYKQLSLAANLSSEENYHIPINVDDAVVDVNLKLVHGGDQGLVTASMTTEKLGQISVQIRAHGEEEIEAIFITESRDSFDALGEIGKSFESRIRNDGYGKVEIRYISGNPRLESKYLSDVADNNNEAVDTTRLYRLAKRFIQSVQTTG